MEVRREGPRDVKAPMEKELRDRRSDVHTQEVHKDNCRQWSRATLESTNLATHWVAWEEFPDLISKVDLFVEAQEHIEEKTIDRNDVIKALTVWIITGFMMQSFVLIVVVAVVVLVIPEFVMLQRQTLCEEKNTITKFLCEEDGYHWADSFIDNHFGYAAGIIGIFTTFFLRYLFPLLYMALYRISPGIAKIVRKALVNIFVDPFVTKLFSNVHGWIQIPCLVAFYSLYISSLLVAAARMNGGIVPLGHLVVHQMSRVLNVILGEHLGVSRMRALRILTVLHEHARANHINISSEQLYDELMVFLSTPPNAGVVEVSLPFLTVMAHASTTTTATTSAVAIRKRTNESTASAGTQRRADRNSTITTSTSTVTIVTRSTTASSFVYAWKQLLEDSEDLFRERFVFPSPHERWTTA